MIDLFLTQKQFLNVREVMELFCVTRRTVYYWIEHRTVESVVIAGTLRVSVRGLRARVRAMNPAKLPSHLAASVQSVTTH